MINDKSLTEERELEKGSLTVSAKTDGEIIILLQNMVFIKREIFFTTI